MRSCKALLIGLIILSLSFGAWRTSAQEPQEPEENAPAATAATPAKPAARSYIPTLDEEKNDADPSQPSLDTLRPDTRPLTGLQTLTVGTREYRHSFWVPGLQYGGTFQSNDPNIVGPSGWYADNYVLGSLSLLENGRHSQLSVNYSGGRMITTDKNLPGGNVQQLGVVQVFNRGRWQLQFLDEFLYLPETPFGFSGATNIGVPGAGGSLVLPSPDLGSNITPTQNISGTIGPRYSNAFATQATYSVTSRASITLGGAYGLLNFVNSANFNTDNAIGSVGYNYALTRKDSIGVFYRFTTFHYGGNPQAVGDDLLNLAYGRKITGRLALQLTGGPEYATFRVPVARKTERLSWSGSASLAYTLRRGGASLSYTHGISGGSGIQVGSNSDYVTASGTRQVGRLWNLIGSFGYARNRNLASTGMVDALQGEDSWFATGGLSRQLGRNALFSFGYTARTKGLSGVACTTSVLCDTNGTQHQVSVGLQWTSHPFVIR
jgi:hypothetical protein